MAPTGTCLHFFTSFLPSLRCFFSSALGNCRSCLVPGAYRQVWPGCLSQATVVAELPPPPFLYMLYSQDTGLRATHHTTSFEKIQVLGASVRASIKYRRYEYQSKPEAPEISLKENELLNGHTLRPSSTGLFHTRKTKRFVDKTLIPQGPRMHGVTHTPVTLMI
uniref:Uncharacterized protein B11E6.140 n=1 Tax=Neurospora crassa TaxID=5141 RepID=Q9HFK2_NEUCS|nr:hypothetical protein [Neurospora crassa]